MSLDQVSGMGLARCKTFWTVLTFLGLIGKLKCPSMLFALSYLFTKLIFLPTLHFLTLILHTLFVVWKGKTGDILYFSHCRQILWKDQQWIDHIIKNCLCSHNKDTTYSPKTVKITWISHTFELSVPCPFVMLNMGTVVEMKQYICDLFLKIS